VVGPLTDKEEIYYKNNEKEYWRDEKESFDLH